MKGTTWERFADGRVLVGVNESDTDFTAGKTGGEKAHKLTTSEMPSHYHQFTINVQHSDGEVVSFESLQTGIQVGGRARYHADSANTGEGSSHNNLQPYVAVYMWRRTA